jgi:nicotinamide mononucleotide transporter
MDILTQIANTFLAQSMLETIAVVCAVLYLVLVVRENIWCWFFAFISTAIYIYLFHSVSLFSESVLNFYYLIMAVYGWWQWHKQGPEKEVKIQKWAAKIHIRIIVGCLLLTPLLGFYMSKVGASFPYLDAFVALLAVAATLMVAYKVFENWYYWLVVDSLSIYLFWQKQMYLTTALFVLYIVLIFVGIGNWKKLMDKQQAK